MPKPTLAEYEVSDAGEIILRFSGGQADQASLDLKKYSLTLQGWHDFLRIAAAMVQESLASDGIDPASARISITITAEREGSFQSVFNFFLLAVAGGVVGNRSDALLKWCFTRVITWAMKLLDAYRIEKKNTTNVESLLAALEALSKSERIPLRPKTDAEIVAALAEIGDPDEEDDLSEESNALRLLVEKVDVAVQNMTGLLQKDCNRIEVIDPKRGVILALDRDDYEALHRPLTLPPPEGLWRIARVRFERINVKTGRSLGYMEVEGRLSRSVDHMKIIDPAIHTPPNVYTAAFNGGTTLQLWARQVRAEKGRLNLMWEVTALRPDQLDLFVQSP
jgi:hypothetical protein